MDRRFLNFSSSSTPQEIKKCFESYADYLQENLHRFPAHAFRFASAEWHYDSGDPRCPHDSWLESLQILETGSETGDSRRSINITATFLGAYHDGTFTVTYTNVEDYRLDKLRVGNARNIGDGHGDWLIDEILVTDDGFVVHDIEFDNDNRWTICCEDIEYKWIPFEGKVRKIKEDRE